MACMLILYLPWKTTYHAEGPTDGVDRDHDKRFKQGWAIQLRFKN